MKYYWNDIKWIFEPDGSLRDIYIQDITLADWGLLIDHLNSQYKLKFGNDGDSKIDKVYILNYLNDDAGIMEFKLLKIFLGDITINCHFFLKEQIEFDFDPIEINSMHDYEVLEQFMNSISKVLKNQVSLTEENTPELPLIKIDTNKGIYKVLSITEAIQLSNNNSSILNQLTLLKTRFKLRFFPTYFNNQLIQSASEMYKASAKNKNFW